uniref:hypothetical protein n=1 Tax=Candidatus Electronema sp. TaxID=2698783 RepID=UPI0040572A67
MEIKDLLVEEEIRIPTPISWFFFLPSKMRYKSISFRGQRWGAVLLDRLLHEADAADIHTVWGSVTQDDVQRTPYLLEWYSRRGFSVEKPDDECVGTAVAKILRTRPNKQPPITNQVARASKTLARPAPVSP